MHIFTFVFSLLLPALPSVHSVATNVKSIFLFKDVLQSNTTALKTSGFDTLVIFRIGVLVNGDLVYYSTGDAAEAVDAPVVTAGSYVGGSALADKIVSFKSGETSVDRVEISLVSADATFRNIQDLITAEGTGTNTTLYRNLDTLKTAWDIDAFNNDDEGVYDITSTVALAGMLGTLGYQYSITPYTNEDFWVSVIEQILINDAPPGLLDRVYLQVYDGGAGNDPGAWQEVLGMKVIPLVWVVNDAKPSQGTTPAQAQGKFTAWYEQFAVAGGGYWNDYDVERMNSSYAEYGGVLAGVFN